MEKKKEQIERITSLISRVRRVRIFTCRVDLRRTQRHTHIPVINMSFPYVRFMRVRGSGSHKEILTVRQRTRE